MPDFTLPLKIKIMDFLSLRIRHNRQFFCFNKFSLTCIIFLAIISLVLVEAQKVPVSKSKSTAEEIVPATRVPQPALRAKVTTERDWIQGSLERHNYYRSLHKSQPLKLNTTLSEISQSFANYLLERAIESHSRVKRVEYFDHNYGVLQNHSLGENLFYIVNYYTKVNASLAVNLWYNEIKDYDFEYARVKATSDPKSLIGHFTQLIWNTTTQMGTAYAAQKLPNNQTVTFVVANYYPAGNVRVYGDHPLKLFLTNVLPPISDTENEIEVVDNGNVIRDKALFWDVPKANLTTPDSWIEASLEKHNEYRRAYRVPELSLSDELCEVAQSWANKLLKYGISEFNQNFVITRGVMGNFAAIKRANFGENLLYFISDGLVDPSYPVKLWFEEKRFYDFENRKTNKTISKTARTDHFEQIVWKSTTHMGIAFASGALENGQILTFVVANYYPSAHHKSFEERIENVPASSAHLMGHNASFQWTITMLSLVINYFVIKTIACH